MVKTTGTGLPVRSSLTVPVIVPALAPNRSTTVPVGCWADSVTPGNHSAGGKPQRIRVTIVFLVAENAVGPESQVVYYECASFIRYCGARPCSQWSLRQHVYSGSFYGISIGVNYASMDHSGF